MAGPGRRGSLWESSATSGDASAARSGRRAVLLALTARLTEWHLLSSALLGSAPPESVAKLTKLNGRCTSCPGSGMGTFGPPGQPQRPLP